MHASDDDEACEFVETSFEYVTEIYIGGSKIFVNASSTFESRWFR